jgi:NhaP-type Na+/H+ or K+/H+ antiporter
MDTALPIIAFGLLIIIGCVLKRVFVLTKIPDIIPLIFIGIIIGPVAGLITPSDLGIVGPIFSLMTLVIILFEGGISLKFHEILGTLRGATVLSILTFMMTAILSAGLLMMVMGEDRMTALIFGCIIGGLSPAVVLPFIKQLTISDKTRTILTIESALADVICIIAVISLLNIVESHTFSPSEAMINLGESFLVAIGAGMIGGIFWVVFRDRIKSIETIFTIPALVCILYGITELLKGSGAISVLVFGIVLGNLCYLEKIVVGGITYCPTNSLSPKEVELFNQLADLLKTFFFIYIGISMVFVSPYMLLFCLVVVGIIHLFRIPAVLVTISPSIPRFDTLIASGMIPKGLATAVLASLPIQYGVANFDYLQPVVFTIIIISIFSSTIIVYILEKKYGGSDKLEDRVMKGGSLID